MRLLPKVRPSSVFALLALAASPLTACGGGSSGDDDDGGGSGEAGTPATKGGTGGAAGGRGGSGGTTTTGDAGDGDVGRGGSVSTGKGGTSTGTGGTLGDSGNGPASSGGTSGGGTGGGTGGGAVSGDVPEELVGVWQETRASGGTYENSFGESFDVTSGFSAQLKLSSNGSYYFAHYASGASATCASVSYFDQSVGAAVLDGNVLTLQPTERRLDVTDCSGTESQDLATDPFSFEASLEEAQHFYGGLRTYKLHLDGGAQPLDLTLLMRPPVEDPVQPAQPDGFALGTVGPFAELQGLWVASPGTDTGFFDPATGDAYLPELNGSAHQWIRFEGDAYETAVALQTINGEGVCKADVIYYEQGLALFQVTEDVGGRGVHYLGDTRLEATAARLLVNVRECDEDDAVYQYDVTPLKSYYSFIYFTTAEPPESLEMRCDFPLSEWQSLLCANTGSLSRRE